MGVKRPAINPCLRRRLFWSIPFLVSALLSLVCFTTLGLYLFPDTVHDLCHTRWFGERELIKRTPGFPLVLEIFGTLIPRADWRLPALSLFQHGLILVDILLIQLIFRDRKQPTLAWIASFCWAVDGRNHVLAQITQTEPVFITLSILWIWATSRWFDRRTWFWAVVGGVTLGLLLPFRTVGILAFPVAAIAFFLLRGPKPWGQSTGYLFAALVVIAAFLWRNEQILGKDSLVEERGLHLLHGVVYHFDELPDKPACREITQLAKEAGYDIYGRDTLWGFAPIIIEKTGRSPVEADALMGDAALEAILDRPIDFVLASVEAIFWSTRSVDPAHTIAVGMDDEYFDNYGRWYEEQFDPKVEELIAKFPIQNREPFLGNGVGYRIIKEFTTTHASNIWRGWWVFPAMIVLGFMALGSRDAGLILCAGFAIATIWASAAGEAPQTRFYQGSVAPFMMAFWMGASKIRRSVAPLLEQK